MTYRCRVLRRLRLVLAPRWIALHLLSIVLIVAMVLLGRWQLDVSNAKHFNIQNFGYAIQWWAFSGFVVVKWVRVLRDAGERADGGSRADGGPQNAESVAAADEPVAYRRYVMPQSSDSRPSTDDPVLTDYNDYLARLDADARVRGGAEGTAR